MSIRMALARQCLNFKGFNCENKDCKNVICPLNKTHKKLGLSSTTGEDCEKKKELGFE